MKTQRIIDPAGRIRRSDSGNGAVLRAGFALVASLALLGAYSGPVSADGVSYQRTYTLNGDFDEGTFDGVTDAVVPDQLQLATVPTTFGFVWIANAGEGTISKVDTNTGTEVARYRTGPGGAVENPSRTSVDINGNCWVANRGTGTVVKILAEGGTNTSTGPGDVKPWGTDDRVVFSVPLSPGNPNCLPRANAIDQLGRVWIGLYNESRYAVVDGTAGTILTYVPTARQPYGAAIDKDGILWSAVLGWGLEKIDTGTLHSLATFYLGSGYGIAVDGDGIVWLGAYPNGGVNRFDPATSTNQYCATPGFSAGRGVCVAPNGNIWLALGYGSPNQHIAKFDKSGNLLNVFGPFGVNPCGVGTDFDGNIVAVFSGTNDIYKLQETDGSVMWSTPVGAGPYTYSDFTGYVIRNLTQQTGTWTTVFDSGLAGMAWGKASWSADTPGTSAVTVEVRAADTAAGLAMQPWLSVSNGLDFGPLAGQLIEIKARLSTLDEEDQPVLLDLTIMAANHPPVAVAMVNGQESVTVEQTSHAGTMVTLDGSLSSDPDGDPLLYEWDFDSDGTYDATGAAVEFTYQWGGPYTATLRVTDPAGLSATDTVEVTVVDTTPPVIGSLVVTPNLLWPPNHQLVPIGINAVVTDICDPEPAFRIVMVTSNEPDNCVGDGNTIGDIVIGGELDLMLRAERCGPRSSRIYTILFECVDRAGNLSTASAEVVVPHDAKKNPPNKK